MMNSFYWTQSLLVVLVAILAFFISFGPSQNRGKWITVVGLAASVALFVANQVVMSNTGDGLDKQLNCLINPAGVACPRPQPPTDSADASPPSLSEAKTLYEQGNSARNSEDYKSARDLLKQSCDAGEPRGCKVLGLMLSYGEGGVTDKRLASDVFKKGCYSGDPETCNLLAIMVYSGDGVTTDKNLARILSRKGCDGGDAFGCSLLAFLFESGQGGGVDKVFAKRLYKLGCDGGDAFGCTSLRRLDARL
jgi:hypothetical protein